MNIDPQVAIRRATLHDIPSLVRLERSSNTAAHWSEQQYASLVVTDGSVISRLAMVAEARGEFAILGFLIAQHIGPEWELENIVVAHEVQGKGVGTRLLNELFAQAKQAHGEAVFLEVRESNLAARRLYEKCGFKESGRRKCYYSNPLEDAILYRRTLETVP